MSKTESQELFDLIKSLSKSEKRYFKVFAAKHIIGEGNKYVTVFDVIDKQTHYDENEILKKAGITKAQLRDHKKHLYKLILRSEENYQYENTIEKKIKHLIFHTEILYNKGLHSQTKKILHKAKHLAQQHEKHELLPEILKLERYLVGNNPVNDWKRIAAEMDTTIKKLENTVAYQKLADKIYSLGLTKGTLRKNDELEEFKNIMKHPLLQNETKAITKKAKYHFFYIHSFFHKKKGDGIKSYHYQKKIVELMESSPHELTENSNSYLNKVSDLCNIAGRFGMRDEFFLSLKKMRGIPELLGSRCTEDMKANVFQKSYSSELSVYIDTCEFKKAVSIIDTIEKQMLKFKGWMSKDFEIVFNFNCAYIYFVQRDYHKALTWNNKIINDADDTSIREDIYCDVRILNLLIHYELGNEALLENVVKSTHRYLYKKEHLYKTETAILNFIRKKMPKVFTDKERIVAFKELKTELEEITKDPYEKNVLKDIDYIAWLESKIEGKSFAEVLNGNYEKRIRLRRTKKTKEKSRQVKKR